MKKNVTRDDDLHVQQRAATPSAENRSAPAADASSGSGIDVGNANSSSPLDLSRLAIDRTGASESHGGRNPRRRKWITRYLLPGGILAGFFGLIVVASGFQLLPQPSVEVIPVIVKRAASQQSGTPLFQAAGWIEPRPTSINVPALAPGVIEELLVVEGQAVKKGEPIANLISIDAEIGVKQAQAELATAVGELNHANAVQRAAKIRQEQPTHLQVQLADAKSALAQAETEIAKLPFQVETAEASVDYAEQSVKGKRAAGRAVPGVVLRKAESELATADATLRELQQRKPNLLKETKALNQKVTALESQLELLVEETRQLEEANARVQSATALRDTASLRLQKSELALARNTIRAPIDGRILKLIAFPGKRVMGMETTAGQDSSSVAEMYDPRRLQVRADVRLEDVPLVLHGQIVEIETASSEHKIQGRVLQTNSSANIQKNTLEVKVEILDPPQTIRPEMLVTTTFLAPEVAINRDKAAESERMFIPKQLIQTEVSQGDGLGAFVWVVDAELRARKKPITHIQSNGGVLVEVTAGLSVTDKLVSSDTAKLRDGARVEVVGENGSLGK